MLMMTGLLPPAERGSVPEGCDEERGKRKSSQRMKTIIVTVFYLTSGGRLRVRFGSTCPVQVEHS